MRAVDTNVLLRLIARDDPGQLAAAEGFLAGGVWISHIVLAEAIWVLTSVYGFTPQQVSTAVAMCLTHRQMSVEYPEAVAAALDEYRNRGSVGFTDYLILEVARRSGHVPLGTFDRKLARLSGTQAL
jgi:predicted nucleic-acid-binding protein